jgi:hypothetical protein
MFRTIAQLIKWSSIPALLVASMFSYLTGSYGPLVSMAVCLGAMVFIQRAVWSREYLWALGLVAIVAAFSPLILAVKIFLLMGIVCVGACLASFVVLHPQPVEIL